MPKALQERCQTPASRLPIEALGLATRIRRSDLLQDAGRIPYARYRPLHRQRIGLLALHVRLFAIGCGWRIGCCGSRVYAQSSEAMRSVSPEMRHIAEPVATPARRHPSGRLPTLPDFRQYVKRARTRSDCNVDKTHRARRYP